MNGNLLRGEEVAEILGVSKAYAYRLMASGGLPIVKLGRSVRVRATDLDTFINSHVQDISSPNTESDNAISPSNADVKQAVIGGVEKGG